MRTISILLFVSILFSSNISRAQHWNSATAITSSQAVYNKGIATDNNGNVFVVGSFNISAIFGSTILMSIGYSDGFIAKYNASGTLLWAKQLAGVSAEDVNAVEVMPNGDIVVAGFFENSVNFAGTQLNSLNRNAFIARLTTNGSVVWIRNVTAPFGGGEATSVAVDNAGNVYMAGHFTLQLDFGTTVLTASGNIDMFVAKYDGIGVLQWVKKGGGSDNSASFYNGDKAHAMAVDPSGTSVFVTGVFNDTATFGAHTLVTDVNYRGEDVFVVKYDATNGNELWARQGGGIGTALTRAGAHSLDEGRAIVADPAGNCYVAGTFDTVAVFGGVTLTSRGITDIFLAKYSSTGNLEWIKQAGGSSYETVAGIDLDFGNNVYITGGFSDTALFGTTRVGNTSFFSDVFVAKYSNTGDFEWVATAGGNNNDRGTALYVDDLFVPNVYVAGEFTDTASFGNTVLSKTSSSTYAQGFVSILNSAPSAVNEEAVDKTGVIIYPNPVEDRLYIKVKDQQQVNQVVVRDIAGRTLMTSSFSSNELSINTKDLPAGILMIEVNGTVHKIAHR